MSNKNLRSLTYILLLITGLFLGSITTRILIGNGESFNKILESTKLNQTLYLIQNHYVDSLNITNFEDKSINAILSELDPHSAYIPSKNFQAIEEELQGSFSGIGVEFNIIEDSIVVVSAISGGPSEKLAVQSGDRIVSVEGENVASIGIKNEEVIKRLRGKKGSIVNIKIKRRGQRALVPFAITRDDIPLYSVDAGIILQNNIGYIKINRFAATTYNEMMQKVNELQEKGMKKLILDLRGNSGGYLHIATQICDEFLKAGELIVFTEGLNRNREETFANRRGKLENTEIIVLIDEGSASASEILSGALQDNDRGLIIGRRSFGKGLVQEQIELKDGSAIRLTTQRYYTPSGRCIQKDYGKNEQDYYLEQYTREKENKPSNSSKFTTKNGRTVYGGGGITPDLTITQDTSLSYLQINRMISKGWLNEFCIKEAENLKKRNISSHLGINISTVFIKYTEFVQEKSPKFKMELGDVEVDYFKNLMKARIARNLWGNDVYFSILLENDEFVEEAVKYFNYE